MKKISWASSWYRSNPYLRISYSMHIVGLTIWHHLFLEFWLVNIWFFAHWRHQRIVTHLENIRQLNIRRGKKLGFQLSYKQPPCKKLWSARERRTYNFWYTYLYIQIILILLANNLKNTCEWIHFRACNFTKIEVLLRYFSRILFKSFIGLLLHNTSL